MNNEEAYKLVMQWPNFVGNFLNEADSAAVILACSLFDDILSRILIAFFVDCKISRELIYGGNAPLGTFSSRIKCTYSLGMLTKDELDDLNKLRKLRNEFAHKWNYLDLNNEKMISICRSMHHIRTDTPANKQTARECFNTVVGVLFPALTLRATQAQHKEVHRQAP